MKKASDMPTPHVFHSVFHSCGNLGEHTEAARCGAVCGSQTGIKKAVPEALDSANESNPGL
jgi:hypothetical protein